jgi:prevent-host-death family protein
MRAQQAGSQNPDSSTWRLEDAKAHFSELVRRARQGIPQHVSVRGLHAVVVLSAADFARLSPAAASSSLAELFADSPLARLDDLEINVVRERAPVRDAPAFDE